MSIKINIKEKEIGVLQLNKELKDAGFTKGFTIRRNLELVELELYDGDSAKSIVDNHKFDSETEQQLKDSLPKPKTEEEIKQEQIAEIDSLTTLSEVRTYLKKEKGLI